MPPPLELLKNLAYGRKNATKMRHFQAQISKMFCGGGAASPSPSVLQPSTPSNFFPNFYIALDPVAVIDEFGKSNRRLVLLVDLGLLNGTRLEVGPVNIQSSH